MYIVQYKQVNIHLVYTNILIYNILTPTLLFLSMLHKQEGIFHHLQLLTILLTPVFMSLSASCKMQTITIICKGNPQIPDYKDQAKLKRIPFPIIWKEQIPFRNEALNLIICK